MSKNKNRRSKDSSEITALGLSASTAHQINTNETVDSFQATDLNESSESKKAGLIDYLKSHLWIVGLVIFLSLAAMGAGLKYLEESAQKQRATNKQTPTADQQNNGSFLSSINPFSSAPLPPSTPQLSKEYIYAGSRMLAVEDAGASAAPPADLAVWRPSDGVWYVMGGPGSQETYFPWGGLGDVPVPGDFDGDGKTDFSIFRPSNGTWYIVKSSDNLYYGYVFGVGSDLPAPADYDGDGKTDAAVFRPSTGYWYINRSSDSGVTEQQFGASGDTPAPADYDGDGKADISVWRTNEAAFYTLRSTDGTFQAQALGQVGNTTVSGDYDGDGKADYAVRSAANWIIKQSSNNQTITIAWQQAGDVAVQNDYDGDGKVDIAVWRDGTGYWYIRNSRDLSTRTQAWGASGDIPVPAFYRR